MANRMKRWFWLLVIIVIAVSAASISKDTEDERRADYERFIAKMLETMPSEELADELMGVMHRAIDSDRRDRRRKERERGDDTDDEALLERIGRLFVQWVNTRLTPRTDEECSWNWGRWRCDPQCDCKYKYRFGDYAPGRSCRLRSEEKGERVEGVCDPEKGNDVSLLEKLGWFMNKTSRRAWRFTTDHVIPRTDEECRFSLSRSLEYKRFVCSPSKRCAFQYKFGDIHPGRACRLRQEGSEAEVFLEAEEAAKRSKDGGSGSGVGAWMYDDLEEDFM